MTRLIQRSKSISSRPICPRCPRWETRSIATKFHRKKRRNEAWTGYQPVIAFSTNESNKKGRKIAPFRASARFKIQFSFSVSSRQSRDDAGLVSLRTDPNMSGVHCCRLLWRLRAPSGYGILVKACRKDKIVWVEAHHRARRRWNSSSHGVSKRFSMEPWLLPPRILSRDWNSWRWWNFSCSF